MLLDIFRQKKPRHFVEITEDSLAISIYCNKCIKSDICKMVKETCAQNEDYYQRNSDLGVAI